MGTFLKMTPSREPYMFYVAVWKHRLFANESLAFGNFGGMELPEKGFAGGPGRPQYFLPTGIAAMTENSFIQLHRGWSISMSPMVVLRRSVLNLYAADISDDECRQEFYFIILKPSNYTYTINIDREVKWRLCCISLQELQMAEGSV